jgi:uracil phosphoribosyltransferase
LAKFYSADKLSPVVHLVTHPLVQDILCELRDARTPPERFRQLAWRISVLLGSEALRDVPTVAETVETPLGPARGARVRTDVVVVPVLRAGLGMLPGLLELVPSARVGHLGLQRDERTAVAAQYYAKLPSPLTDSFVLMIDPMLATGGSAVAALDGIALVEQAYPQVPIYTPVVDERLNDHKYIVPGLGDFGDRLYGTS